MINYDNWKLAEPDNINRFDIIEVKTSDIDPLESIINELCIIGAMDKKAVLRALKTLLDYSQEPGINLTDIHKILQITIETI